MGLRPFAVSRGTLARDLGKPAGYVGPLWCRAAADAERTLRNAAGQLQAQQDADLAHLAAGSAETRRQQETEIQARYVQAQAVLLDTQQAIDRDVSRARRDVVESRQYARQGDMDGGEAAQRLAQRGEQIAQRLREGLAIAERTVAPREEMIRSQFEASMRSEERTRLREFAKAAPDRTNQQQQAQNAQLFQRWPELTLSADRRAAGEGGQKNPRSNNGGQHAAGMVRRYERA
jgi:hypothetical protein